MQILATSVPYPQMDGSQPCRRDPEAWFPEARGARSESLAAASLCQTTCRFTEQCLAFAMAHDVAGTWGGVSERRRKEIRRQRGIIALPLTGAEGTTLTRMPADSPTCRSGHERNEANAYRNLQGGWECRPCRRDADARRKEARRDYYREKQRQSNATYRARLTGGEKASTVAAPAAGRELVLA